MKLKLLTGALVVIAALTTLGGCKKGPKKVNYVDSDKVRLTLDYKGRDFYKDGIGQVTTTSTSYIDGDTTHFVPVVTTTKSERIKSRYYGIDTPESTGKVQEWGKTASEFTKAKLKEANENGTIVVSTPQSGYAKPQPDSTGSRYISLVWICLDKKDADLEDLRLLNLWIVQEGLSYVKNVADVPEYADTFIAAEEQARDLKLCLFSPESEPGFNSGDYINTSLLDIKIEVEKSLADPDYKNAYDNQRVRVQGTVAGYVNNILYLQAFFTKEQGARTDEGEYAGINVFCGMSSISSKFSTRNTLIELSGLCQDSEIFGFQITSVYSFSIREKDPNDTKVILSPEANTDQYKLTTLEYAANDLKGANYASLFCNVKITDPVEVEDVYIASNSEITLYLKDCEFDIYVPFLYYGNPDMPNQTWNTKDKFIGHKFMVTGIYTFHKTTSGKTVWQINPTGGADLVFVE